MKMKSGKMSIKLNLLAILLMAALLVTTLTSCGSQGEKGERGAKGDRGENGADGETPYIGENQNWWVWDVDTEDYVDSGVSAEGKPGQKGDTPVRGVDYWTDADKNEIKSYVDEAILGGAW